MSSSKRKAFEDEVLIAQVEKHKILYDKTDTYYDDVQKRENCWKEIAKVMDEKEDTCRKKWKHLREAYRKALRVRENREIPCRPWKFEKQMEFLKCFMGKAKRKREEDDQEMSGEETASDPESSNQEQSYKISKMNPISTPVPTSHFNHHNCNNTHERDMTLAAFYQNSDPITKFFCSMADSVKTLPLPLQIKVKKEVLDVVSNAELEADSGNF